MYLDVPCTDFPCLLLLYLTTYHRIIRMFVLCELEMHAYHVDELNHREAKIDGDRVAEVMNRANQRIVSLALEEMLHQSHFILTSKT